MAVRRILLSLAVGLIAVWPAALAGADTGVDWTATPPDSGRVVGNEVEVKGPGTHRLTVITAPGIQVDGYAIEGTVRYEAVDGTGYLEMWSYMADGSRYFSRTLADSGPMASLIGDSPARPFELPFSLNGADGPQRVEVNVVLPSRGTVWVGPLTLVGFRSNSAWWSERTSILVGAALGGAAGLSGAAIGLLSRKLERRPWVEAILRGGLLAGMAVVVVGGVALAVSQPRYVWYPLLLIGTILLVVFGALWPTMRRNYAAAELRRMRALDV